jgi:DeoR/GlpR family transcriptional regulator of sugar metabolism
MPDLDRHERIASLVAEHGFLSVRELSEQLSVSEMTIRRDLSRLGNEALERTYGRAVATDRVGRLKRLNRSRSKAAARWSIASMC